MGDVLEVIKKAQQTVNIMIDICAYGHYSYPEMFFNYRLALEELAHRGVKVRMIVYDHARAAQDQEDVFYSVPGFFEREVNSKRFEHFFLSNRGLKRATTQDELKKVLFSEQAKYEAWLSDRGVEIRTVCETMLLFTWMADREDAVFSFRSEKGEREISFRTRDGNLLSTIGEDVFEQIWRQAAPINKAATTASA